MKRIAPSWLAAAAVVALAASVGCSRSDRGTTSSTQPQGQAASNTAGNTDWTTTTRVQAKFFQDDTVKGRNIDVDSSNGVVTLSGTVDSQQAKDRAVALAREVDGVVSVNDQLQLRNGNTAEAEPDATGAVATTGRDTNSATSDNGVTPAWITTKIQAQYFTDSDVKPWNVDVTTHRNGTVTLEGTVDSATARAKAESIARGTDGVSNVDNRLRVKNGNENANDNGNAAGDSGSSQRTIDQPDAWITAKVQSKYFLDDTVKGRDINVDTRGGVVTLNGKVSSDAERNQAIALARNTDGVTDVKDELNIDATAVANPGKDVEPVQHLPRPNQVDNDSWITTKIRSRMFIDPNVKNMNVDVTTSNGVVTLTGQVKDQSAKTAAEAIAKQIDGVKRVNNQLTIGQ
jgi:hyperosmotically inducible protein